MKISVFIIFLFSLISCQNVQNISCQNVQNITNEEINLLQDNANAANEAFFRSHNYVKGWLTKCDTVSGLIPKDLNGNNYWNAQDAAADNYPFMVLTTFFTDKKLFKGKMLNMLNSEIKLTSRIGACPATYDFKTHTFKEKDPDVGNIIFGSAEYMKDGLLPLTEWLGESPWSERMINILNELKKITKGEPVKKIEGEYLAGLQEIEVNGDLLQVLSRMYWMTGCKDYLEWAKKIADLYLLNDQFFINNTPRLRLRDHGGEIVLGLCELYATLNYVDKTKKEKYKPALYAVLDRILESGRNNHGMFYDEFSPKNGIVISKHLADTWGYILDGFYTVYLIDNYKPYREAVLFLMNNLRDNYQYYNWEYNSSDGMADAIESAINLYNREPIESVSEWIDKEIAAMFKKQKSNGIIEGWHGDGNFARTAIMYALWKTKGCYVSNWNQNLYIGSLIKNNQLTILIRTNAKSWNGRLFFDKKRHKKNLHLPLDWTRINQFPEWYTLNPESNYKVSINGKKIIFNGKELYKGLKFSLQKGEQQLITIKEL